MPLYRIQGPDGKTYSLTGPEGATREQVIAEITRQLGSSPVAAKTEQPAEPSSIAQRAGDLGLSLAQGTVGLGEAAVGLANIPTLGLAGKAAEAGEKALFGGTSSDLQKYLESKKTPETRQAEENVQNAKGFWNTAGAYLENPSALAGTVAESVPSMVGAAGIGRGLMGVGAKTLAAEQAGAELPGLMAKKYGEKAGLYAAAAGEGAISAGSTAESIRQQAESGDLSAGQAAIAGVSGALTGALGVFGGKIADKLDVQDIDRLMLGDIRKVSKDAEKQSIIKQAVKGAISESAFEELPQSMQEQISQNLATGKPWDENVLEAGASGAMAALVMGGAGAGASQVITNANIKAKQKLTDLQNAKPSKSMFEEQDEEDAAAGQPPIDQSADYTVDADGNVIPTQPAEEVKQKEKDVEEAAQEKPTTEQPPVEQPIITREAEDLLASVDEGGVPGFMTNNLRRIAQENGITVSPSDTPDSVIEAIRAKKEAGVQSTEQPVKQPTPTTQQEEVDDMVDPNTGMPYFSRDQEPEETPFNYEEFSAQLEKDKQTIAELKARFAERDAKKLPGIDRIEDEYRRASNAFHQAQRDLDRVKGYAPDHYMYSDEYTKANKAMDRWFQAHSNLRDAEEGIEFSGYQKPLFSKNQGSEEDIYGPERKFTSEHNGELWTYFGPGAEVNQDSYPGSPAKVVDVNYDKWGDTSYTLEIDTSNHPEGYDENGNKVNTKRAVYTAERLNKLNPPAQQPQRQGQQGFDFGEPTDERAKPIERNQRIAGQQGLDFTQEAPTGEPVSAPKPEKPKFGYTTDTSATPLMQFLSQFKARSSSPVEQVKQQNAIANIKDEIEGLYDGVEEKDLPYVKGVIDSFFDKYASGTNLPSKEADLNNLNNLNAADQKSILDKHTHLPDLTTYEGAKKLAEDFSDHVAEAQLAGLGITKSSSAYRQADPIVRNLRNKPKSQYDEADKAAFSYFNMFNLDTALRAAAFDIATNTPRNQLFRGQGKDFAELFNEWLITNDLPLKVQHQFAKYVQGYKKQNEGFKAFEAIQTNKENEKEYVESYLSPDEGPQFSREAKHERAYMMSAPLHPAAIEFIRNNKINEALKVIANTSASRFQRSLARRLMELDLTTSTGVDVVETLAEDYTRQTKNLLGKLADAAEALMPDMYKGNEHYGTKSYKEEQFALWDNTDGDGFVDNKTRFKEMVRLSEIIRSSLAQRNITEGAIFDVLKDFDNIAGSIDTAFNANGVYFPRSDCISINSDGGLKSSTVLHEIMHAATTRIINNPNRYSSKQQAAVAELKKLYELAKEHKDFNHYGLTDLNEFVAEAFTNGTFQDFLKKIKYKYSNQSLWDKFVTYCLEIFGFDNVLSATVANVNVLFEVPTKGQYTTAEAPPLFAKRNKDMFEGNSAERTKPFEVLNELVRNNEKWEDVKDKFARALETMNTQTRKHWLGAFTLRQMEEMIGTTYGRNVETGKMEHMSKIPQISKFMRAIEAMTKERSEVIHEATTISKELMNIQRENQPTVEHLTKIIQTATTEEVDPTKPAPVPKDPNNPTEKEEAQMKAYPMLKEAWGKLGTMKNGKEAQELYLKMRDFFKHRLDEFKNIATDREFARLENEAKLDPTADDYDDQLKQLRDTARETVDSRFTESIEPYFPLKRFGEFWVRYGTGKNRKYMQFEDASAKNKYLRKARAEYAATLRKKGFSADQIEKEINNPKVINHGNSLPDMAGDLFADRAVYEEVKNIVSTIGGQTVTDPEELRKLVLDQLGELYITTLPLQSIQRMFLHRQNIAGASTDLIRSFQHTSFHMAYQHARFKYAPKMDDQLLAAKQHVSSIPDADEKAILNDYLNEINNKYQNNVIKPPPSNWLTNKLSNINFLWFLTAPASAIVNMMAVPSIALPVLGGKFGTTKSWKAMTKYMGILASSGWKDETGNFDAPSIGRSSKLTDLQKRAYAAFSESLLEQSLAHDAASLAENPSLDYSGRWGKVMQIATFPFHKAERFNREITAMAAFDLAYEKNGGNFDAAIKEASDLTWKTMFDYATYNKPRYMQGNVAKVLLAFKQYSQHMTYLLFRTAYEATQNISKEEYDEVAAQYGEAAAKKYEASTNELRAQARKTFMLMMGSSFIFAGAAGLPIWWIYSGIANAFHAVFGDPEETYDVENEFKNSMNNTFGGFVGDSIARGVVPQLTGASLSDRMSTNLPDMWFRDTKKNQDEVSNMQNMLINLMGPTAGLAMNSAEALKRFNDGNTERAFEAIAPGAFKNLLAGSRLASEGALTMKGDTLMENVSNKDAFMQMLGFTPETLAQRQSANIEAKGMEQAVLTRRQDLLNFLAMALEREDDSGEAKVLAKIEDFNEANPWAKIDSNSIRQSLSKRAKVKAMADELGGLRINKKFADDAEELTAYGSTEEE